MTATPTSMKIWLSYGAAACQMVARPRITSGQIEMAKPAIDSPKIASDYRNGATIAAIHIAIEKLFLTACVWLAHNKCHPPTPPTTKAVIR